MANMTCFGNFSFGSGETAVKDEARTNRYSFFWPDLALEMGGGASTRNGIQYFSLGFMEIEQSGYISSFGVTKDADDTRILTAGCKTCTWVRFLVPSVPKGK